MLLQLFSILGINSIKHKYLGIWHQDEKSLNSIGTKEKNLRVNKMKNPSNLNKIKEKNYGLIDDKKSLNLEKKTRKENCMV